MVKCAFILVLAGLLFFEVTRRTTCTHTNYTAHGEFYRLRNFQSALERYKEIGGQYPSEEQGLEALHKMPATDPLPLRWTQMGDGPNIDPWGTAYQYHFPGNQNPEKPEVISAGADKTFGTEDDLSSQDEWENLFQEPPQK